MSGTLRKFSVVLVAWAAAALFSGCPIDPGTDPANPAGVVLERSSGNFVPGQELTVTVTITAKRSSTISAIGLTETVPEGWTYVSMDGEAGQAPAIAPHAGGSGDLGFIWITMPDFPITFTYTLQVPEGAVSPAEISGQVDYYQALGMLSSDVTVSSLTSAAG